MHVYRVLGDPSIDRAEEVQQVTHELSWIDPFIKYIIEGDLPSDRQEAKLPKQRVSRFMLLDGQLYRKSSYPLLKCLGSVKADLSLKKSMKASAEIIWGTDL